MAITPGSKIEVRTASGTTVAMLAVSEPMQGQDFPVVWVCTPDEFERAKAEGDEPDSIPWPLDAVTA